ncbi:nicotinamidase-related amidase [Arthrobacter sp. GAS37]
MTLINIEGKGVFTELAEIVDPAHTALLLIDMQRDFVDPEGAFGELGVDLSMYTETRPRLAALLASARLHRALVIHVQNTALPDRMSDSPAQIRFNLRMHEAARRDAPPLRYTVPGTPGHEFVEEFTPLPGELVVPKYRSSAFWGANLEMLLRSNGIQTLVVGGCTTEGCVESTARDAMFNDHYVVIASDCVGSDDKAQHDASMLLMGHRFDLATADEIGAAWQTLAADALREMSWQMLGRRIVWG